MEEKLKILLITQDPKNNISFYRGKQPLQRLSEHHPIEYFVPETSFVIEEVKKYDIVLISCPYTIAHKSLVEWCIRYNVAVWIDIDDLLTDISIWNESAFLEYSNHPVKHVVEYCISNATWVTVSTNKLKSEWSHLSDHIYIVENAFDHEFLDKPATIGTKNEVLHRGGKSHNIDLWTYHKSIVNSLKDSGWNAHFVGMNPIYINMELNGTWTRQLSKREYWNFLEKTCEAKLVIVPLVDTPFNHAKSCIAWIEATYAGAAVLAPNWTEWQKPGIINYNNKVDFEAKLNGVISNRILLRQRVDQSREYIMNCQTLLKVNEKRWRLIEKYHYLHYVDLKK